MRIRQYFAGLSVNTFLLALASIADISTEMLYPILPEFLRKNLGATPKIVGRSTASPRRHRTSSRASPAGSRTSSSAQADRFVGYRLAALAKPLIGLSTNWPAVLGSRFLDRLASGTRSAPPRRPRGRLRRAGQPRQSLRPRRRRRQLRAFVGPLIGWLLLTVLVIELPTIFLLAFVPGALAFLMVLFVREKRIHIEAKAKLDLHLKLFPRRCWIYLGVTALFGVGNSSNMFLIMRTAISAATLEETIFVYTFYNLVARTRLLPGGLSLRSLGRRIVLLLRLLALVVVSRVSDSRPTPWCSASLHFLSRLPGIFRTVGRAFASDFAPPELHRSRFGWFPPQWASPASSRASSAANVGEVEPVRNVSLWCGSGSFGAGSLRALRSAIPGVNLTPKYAANSRLYQD